MYVERISNYIISYMKTIAKLLLLFRYIFRGVINRFLSFFLKKIMLSCGKNVRFSAITSDITYSNISIGNDVYIGPNACLVATESKIYIGNKVLFGPHVTIVGGDHRIFDVGMFIYDIKEKQPGDDIDVIIEDDVWIGTNVTILKGVRIGRGSVVAAGSVVVRDVQPYSIVGGVPSKVLKYRFNIEEILQHEKILYSESLRYTKELLIKLRK